LEHPEAAPHGVYPALGDDRWIAIAIFDEAEWSALKSVMGNPAWADASAFATLKNRLKNQDELDRLIGSWSKQMEPRSAMNSLQKLGVRAAVVQNAEDLNEFDPQLAERGLFFSLDHPVIGEARFEGMPIKLSATNQVNWRSGPLLGEDTRYVLTDILGLADDEVSALEEEGVV